jgi:hypothetical protein
MLLLWPKKIELFIAGILIFFCCNGFSIIGSHEDKSWRIVMASDRRQLLCYDKQSERKDCILLQSVWTLPSLERSLALAWHAYLRFDFLEPCRKNSCSWRINMVAGTAGSNEQGILIKKHNITEILALTDT